MHIFLTVCLLQWTKPSLVLIFFRNIGFVLLPAFTVVAEQYILFRTNCDSYPDCCRDDAILLLEVAKNILASKLPLLLTLILLRLSWLLVVNSRKATDSVPIEFRNDFPAAIFANFGRLSQRLKVLLLPRLQLLLLSVPSIPSKTSLLRKRLLIWLAL